MKYYRRFGEWLFRFASSQENVDRVAKWLYRTIVVVVGTFVLAIVLFVTLERRW